MINRIQHFSLVNKEKIVIKLKICTPNCIFVEIFPEWYTFYLPFKRVEYGVLEVLIPFLRSFSFDKPSIGDYEKNGPRKQQGGKDC